MIERMRALRPELTQTQLEQFDAYYRLLTEWNERMNLTAITAPDEVAQKHFADSLAALPYLPTGARCIDVGTGAGFPGVPLLIARPELSMTLMDGLGKRITFLETLCETLGLRAACVHLRAEDAGQDPAYRGTFDIALTRAVAALPVLLELTVPLLTLGGKSICYKGDAKEELMASRGACHLLHCAAECVTLESAAGARCLVIAEKKENTPKAYPRRAGMPEKKPL